MKNALVNSVSVIIPTYNRLNEAKRAIESVISQSHKPLEIIVIDDGSDISVKNDLRLYLISKEIVLVELEHTGNPGYLRKIGIEAARGEWIAFLDDDDFWHPRKLEVQLKFARSINVGFVSTLAGSNFSPGDLFDFDRIDFKRITRRSMLSRNSITNSSVLVQKSLLQSIGGYADSDFVIGAEDYATWLRLLDFTSLIMVSEVLTFYDRSDTIGHLSSKFSNRYMQNIGVFDYLEWTQNNSTKKFIIFRLFLKFARLFI